MESENELEGGFSDTTVVEVIPIVRGITKPSLSYFTRGSFPLGSFVKIPVRSGHTLGLVIGVRDARSAKTDLKQASFALKKLSGDKDLQGISPAFIKAAEKTAEYYATTVGSVLGAILPKLFIENPSFISSRPKDDSNKIKPSKEALLVQLNDEERYREYKSLIRESFAKKKSVLFCVPTHEETLRAFDFLSKGISDYAYITSKKSPKRLKEMFKEMKDDPHPILIVTTPAFIAFDRPDLETIILERENSRSYRMLSRPYMHTKVFLEFFARESRKTLILGDSVLSLETLWQEKQGKYAIQSDLKWRTTRSSRSVLVDMKPPKRSDESGQREFEILSPALIRMIEKAQAENRKVFLFGVRKGLAPSTACSDCGSLLSCENCSAPLVLHNKNDARIYICHACGARRGAETRCDHCESWNLTPIGVGIDRIAETVKGLFPDTKVHILDKEHAPTPVRATQIAKKFASEKGGIMIGTELAFLYLEKVPYVGLVSLDSLFSIPDFGIHERIFYLVTRLLEISEVETVIQTRNIGKEILSFAEKGNILDFYRTEIAEREGLRYPPFSMFIKVTVESTSIAAEKKATYLKEIFIAEDPHFMMGKDPKSGKLKLSMILRLPKSSWPHRMIREKLLLLPPEFLIKVDPESIL